MIDIKHVMQQCPRSCAVACIAMVTGKPFDEIRKQASQPNLGDVEADNLLAANGVRPTRSYYNELKPGNIYLMHVPSLNLRASMHCIVVDCREDFKVLDPNKGRDGADVYDEKTVKAWGSLIKIDNI